MLLPSSTFAYLNLEPRGKTTPDFEKREWISYETLSRATSFKIVSHCYQHSSAIDSALSLQCCAYNRVYAIQLCLKENAFRSRLRYLFIREPLILRRHFFVKGERIWVRCQGFISPIWPKLLHQNLNSAAGAENFSPDQTLLSLVSHDFPMEHSPSKQGFPNSRVDRYIFHHVLFLALG